MNRAVDNGVVPGPVTMRGRQQDILALLADGAERSVHELAARFGVTLMTVRRDLEALARGGHVTRTHGGVVLSRPGTVAFHFHQREERMLAEKAVVARAVAALVRPGMAISLDTGTTTLAVARALAGQCQLQVLTSSLAIAAVLYACEGIDLVLLGGRARKDNPDLYGELTEENLARFHVDLAVLGADAVNPDGLYTTQPDIARVSQAMLRHAGRRVLVADHSKFGHTAFLRFATWNDITTVVADDGMPAVERRWLKDTGAEIIYAR